MRFLCESQEGENIGNVVLVGDLHLAIIILFQTISKYLYSRISDGSSFYHNPYNTCNDFLPDLHKSPQLYYWFIENHKNSIQEMFMVFSKIKNLFLMIWNFLRE